MSTVIDLLTSPWAIVPDKLLEIQGIYATHLRGEKIDIDALEARLGQPLANDQQDYRVEVGGVAVLSIAGVIANKANMFTRISGGTSAQMLAKQVDSIAADHRVRSAVIDIDSPGGSVLGIPALAEAIRALAAAKPTVAVSTGQMASAGYWIGSAANAVYISGTTDVVGSIGVVATHQYNPKASGPVTTEITAGKYKRMATDSAPLTKEGRAYLQAQVDHIYSVFVDAVAANRRVSAELVVERMADGKIFIGQQAIDAGLVDGVATVDQMIAKLSEDPAAYASRRKAHFALGGLPEPEPGGDPAPGANDDPVPAVETLPKGPTMTPQETLAAFAKDSPEAYALALAAGAQAERDRIAAVRSQALPGHDALIEALAADGKTSGAEAAMAVNAAERERIAAASKARLDNAPKPVPQAPAVDEGAPAAPVASKIPGYQVNADAADLDRKAKAYQATHPGVDYVAAYKAVQAA